ncbi:2'-5' RNA ligase family protein [Streptomyces sp. NPDC050658]|uniref:2'-5' RNA ligase family protein n=1 Tax=unclassified Streptomyces TaxID=2593676 RepID=UPI00343E60FB
MRNKNLRKEPQQHPQKEPEREPEGEPAGKESGWPDRPGETALTIKVPEADQLVRADFPAHVTVLYPFLHESRIDKSTDAELSRLFTAHPEFTLDFTEFRRYPGVLYLPPAPPDPIQALTQALTTRWPEAIPYRGIFGPEGLDPHLTIANHEGPKTYETAYDTLQSELAPHLPLRARVGEVHLIVKRNGAWQNSRTYALTPTRSGSGSGSYPTGSRS